MLKTAFGQMVASERGDKLRISRDELVEGRIYPGVTAVRLGLVDEIGGESDAIQKVAELAGISNYGFVDVNLEVLRELLEDLQRILPPLGERDGDDSGLAELLALVSKDFNGDEDTDSGTSSDRANNTMQALRALRTMMLNGNLGTTEEDPLPDFPLDINRPNMYYLYVGHGP
jgi:ClpP class serine protease